MGDDPTEFQAAYLDELPITDDEAADILGTSNGGIRGCRSRLREKGYSFRQRDDGAYECADESTTESDLPDLSDVDVTDDANADPSTLSDRQAIIVNELQRGTTPEALADELDERPEIITSHFKDLKRQGWNVYVDETAEHVAIESDETLRSSEHKGTRTRKANRWWETRHNALERRVDALEIPRVSTQATEGNEDWCTHMTDLHAGDKVRGYEGDIIHTTEDLLPIIDYITDQSLRLSKKHNSDYDTAYLLWGGDFVTNEAIYEGQFEDLDAWLDEQVDLLHDPLLRQIKTFSKHFENVVVVMTPGNHGDIRASGSSKQANADLILYKSIRNTVSALQEMDMLGNVGFEIGRAGNPNVFTLRDGKIHGQLRHGQDRKPQAETSARGEEWLSTVLDSMNFGSAVDMIWMGHHHVQGRIPWNGPPIFVTGSPKPGGDYPRKLGKLTGPNTPKIAHCHGVNDDGITGVFPIDTRNYDHET